MQINRVLSQFRESLEIFLIFPTATFRKGSLSTRKFLKTVFYRSFIRNFEHAFPLRFLSLCSRAQISRAPHLKETSVSKKETKKRRRKKNERRKIVYRFTNLNNGETNVPCSISSSIDESARSLDFSLWTVYYVMKSILRNKKIMIDDKWLERSWEHERSVTRREDTFSFCRFLPFPPSFSLFSPLFLLFLFPPPLWNNSSIQLEGNRHKAINFVVWEYRICCLLFPSPPFPLTLSSKRQRGSTTVLWLYFSCNRYLQLASLDENAFIKCNVNKW